MSFSKEQAIIEAMLFATGREVSKKEIMNILEIGEDDIEKIIENMRMMLEEQNSSLEIVKVEDSYQMCTKKEYYEYLISIAAAPKKPALTEVMLETLSIIVYKQPITKMEIEKIRGVKCDHAVNKLVEYNLVKELGRLDVPGKPILFGTTEEFLRSVGVTGLEALPVLDPVKLEDFKAEAEEEIQFGLKG